MSFTQVSRGVGIVGLTGIFRRPTRYLGPTTPSELGDPNILHRFAQILLGSVTPSLALTTSVHCLRPHRRGTQERSRLRGPETIRNPDTKSEY